MIEINPSLWKQNPPPLPHQITGVRALVSHPAFMLADEPRTMKSRQVVDAACILREAGLIDLVVVIARVGGRGVWGNAKIGQIKHWSWLPVRVHEFHEKQRDLWSDENPQLTWVVTNYDFIRSPRRLEEFLARLAANYKKPWVVFDESHKLGNENSLQAKAAMEICWNVQKVLDHNGKVARINYSPRVARRTMLTGTPGSPLKHWSQFNILDHVLDRRYKNVRTFKWRFVQYDENGVMRPIPGRNGKKGGLKLVHKEVGWKNLDALSKITSRWALMRKRRDCQGLRDVKVVSSFEEVRLSKETWKLYQSLKRDAIAELSSGETYVSPNKGVCLQRLSQICSGHLGGFIEGEPTRWLSDEKIDWLLNELQEECVAKAIIVWVRYSAQRKRLAEKLREAGFIVHQIHGGQNAAQRRNAELIFSTGVERVEGRHVLVAQCQAGGDSNDFSAASNVYRLSEVWGDWITFAQSNDRPLGLGQKAEYVKSTDVIATGPDGQRTMDHVMLESRETGRIVEKMSCSEWLTELRND